MAHEAPPPCSSPRQLRARNRAEKRRLAPNSGWAIKEAMFPADFDGIWHPPWAGHEFAGQQAATEIYWTRDDPHHRFLTVEDCPGMAAVEVERMNAPYRSAHLVRIATMTAFDLGYFGALYDALTEAWWRRPIARARATAPEHMFRDANGGWLPEGVPLDDADQLLEILRERQRLRARRAWQEADILKQQAWSLGVTVRDFSHGTEWLRRLQ